MALPVSVPYAFANATTTQNLSYLDSNFNAIANGLNGLANGASQISISSISATGNANATTFLRGDGSWATVSGGGTDVTYSNVTVTQNLVPPSSFLRNRIINGNMTIDQRNAGSAWGTSINGYCVDRWQCLQSTTGKLNGGQNYNSITLPAGFPNYIGVQSQSSYSVGSTDYYALRQTIEGYNIADLGWGTASAKTITLSFQVYSSLTGTFGGSILNSAQNRSYPFTYSIGSANTWASISITIPGDTTGTWLTTTGKGIDVFLGLGVGSTYSGTAGAWAGSIYYSATSAVSVVGTSSATFYITGVQLEVGTVATPFERRLYGTELQLCQRYYEKSYNQSVAPGTSTTLANEYLFIYAAATVPSTYSIGKVKFSVTKRAAPTVNTWGKDGTATVCNNDAGTNFAANSANPANISDNGFEIANTSGGALTITYNTIYTAWAATAEL
jgi:hypothetical protein